MTRPLSRPLPTPAVRGLALACALMVWVLGLLAASPELHAALHADAGHVDHECAITLFNQGTESPATGAALVVAPVPTVVACSPVTEPNRTDSPSDRLPPGCGPPVR